jgi:hypothetical protein
MQRCVRCGRTVEAAATMCACGADLWHGSAAESFPRPSNPQADPYARLRTEERAGLHPWCGPAAAGAFVLGWITTAFLLHSTGPSTDTTIRTAILALLVSAGLVALGLAMAVFRRTRDSGIILAFSGGAYLIGLFFGVLIL